MYCKFLICKHFGTEVCYFISGGYETVVREGCKAWTIREERFMKIIGKNRHTAVLNIKKIKRKVTSEQNETKL